MNYSAKLILLFIITFIFSLTVSGCANKSAKNQSQDPIGASDNQTIIDQWSTIAAPPAPELKSVSADPKTTALLILDMQTSMSKIPRCAASIPKIHELLTQAHEKNMLVVYSLTSAGNPSDITSQLTPTPSDPIVKSSVDKFYNTDLENILQKSGIKTVLVTGTAANGAVLHTAISAALRGYHIIIPVDTMSAENPYAEQYTAWHMMNSPGARNRVTLTKASQITF